MLAHDFENERYSYLKEMWGHIAVFIRIMRCIGEVNAIELPPKHEPMPKAPKWHCWVKKENRRS